MKDSFNIRRCYENKITKISEEKARDIILNHRLSHVVTLQFSSHPNYESIRKMLEVLDYDKLCYPHFRYEEEKSGYGNLFVSESTEDFMFTYEGDRFAVLRVKLHLYLAITHLSVTPPHTPIITIYSVRLI